MAKNLKIKIKKTQLAKAAGLDKLKAKLSGEEEKKKKPAKKPKPKAKPEKAAKPKPLAPEGEEKPRRIRAKSKSAFAPKEEKEPRAEEEVAAEKATKPAIKKKEAAEEPKGEILEEEAQKVKLGPTGKHIKDLLPPKKEQKAPPKAAPKKEKETHAPPARAAEEKPKKGKTVREFKDLKPARRQMRSFDSRDRMGLSAGEEDRWRKRRAQKQQKVYAEEDIVRPTALTLRLPITVKDLAAEMKLKASELISKLFMQGVIITLNDMLDDETTIQLLGQEFGCEITIDTSQEERILITSQSVQEEIAASEAKELTLRPPVVTFMGHVDHGKTSLIDKLRSSNIVAGEAGAITQHMGAFRCTTKVGDLTVLDTPGHEAFSAMRARGAEVTDIVVLVIAGDEGMRDQTIEAIQHARAAKVTIVVAINKCDKPNFNADNVYRELSEQDLLPEPWGGQTIVINTSAVTGEGLPELLEMLALQAEVLELRANPTMRARGTVLESEMHKGLGTVARILVQNGTLHQGDAVVFERLWGRVKTMHDEHGKDLTEAAPSTPVEITGLSGLPSAGDPFIVVKSEKEAREIAEARAIGQEQRALLQKRPSLDKLLQKGEEGKKVLNLIIRGDVQGSVEALKTSLYKIESEKAEVVVIFTGVGEVTESDVQLASASNAVILGFHTKIESKASDLIKEQGVTVRLHDIIYNAITDVKDLMQGLLDKIEEEKEMGQALVQATFKASQLGVIAGCLVTEGTIHRNHLIRVVREDEVIWKGKIASIKRVKEDVKEVKKGVECGIVLEGYNEIQEGDRLEAFEIIYLSQEL